MRAAHGADAPLIAVDTSGARARARSSHTAAPDLIKPNDEELAELAGAELDGGGDLAGEMLRVARTPRPGSRRAPRS